MKRRISIFLTKLADVFADQVRDRAVGITDITLLGQAHIAVESLELPLHDLAHDSLRLARRLLSVDLPLLLDQFGGKLLAPHATRIRSRDLHRDFLDQGLKLRRLGDEVALAIDLNQHAQLPAGVDISADRALRRDPPRAPGGLRDTLLAQPERGLLHIAAALRQRLLAIHHACAGFLAQFLHQFRVEFCHQFASCTVRPVFRT